MEKIPFTRNGLDKIKDELEKLKSVDRPEIIKAIAEARAHGDLSENAEYHAAKEKQSFTEGRIKELEDAVSRAEVIDPAKLGGETVTFGTEVTIADEETDEEKTYSIVGPFEADHARGFISTSAPLARSLIGKRVGDSAEVAAPGGKKSYEILEIKILGA